MSQPFSATQLEGFLDSLPRHRPFTAAEADGCLIGPARRGRLIAEGLLVRRLPGVFSCSELPDDIDLRLACLALVVPADCVVTDRTAAWVWVGQRALAPGEHLCTPRISVFAPPGRRLRNGLVLSGERALTDHDVTVTGGVRVTTPLRTACDLGRLLHVDQAFAAMDSLATTRDFETDELVEELTRFRGYRGIVQARTWAPYVDPGSDSQFESVSRRRWLTAGLPRPECQCPVPGPAGTWYYVDFGLPAERFGGEFFGEEFHGEAQQPHDEHRLQWLREARSWVIVVARKVNVVGQHQDFEMRLRQQWERHRSRARRIA